MEQNKIKIMTADDHPLIRSALRTALSRYEEFEIVGEASDGEEAVKLALELVPDVIIMDINMPKLNGLEATRNIKEKCPEIAVLILTIYDDDEHISAVLECGAAGYLTKKVFDEEIIQAVRATAAGESVLTPTVLEKILARHIPQTPKPIPGVFIEKFSIRELDIIGLVARGASNKEIAQELNISISTVRGYLEQIFAKLNVASRTEAVVTALKIGILKLDDLHAEQIPLTQPRITRG